MDFFEGWDAKRNGTDRQAAPVAAPVNPGAATPYALAALQGEVENLTAVPVGSGRNDQLNRSAVKMYGLVAAGQIDERTVTETLGAADGGLDFPATRRTLQSARDAVFTRLGARNVPEPTTSERIPPWETRSDDPLDDNFDPTLIRASTGTYGTTLPRSSARSDLTGEATSPGRLSGDSVSGAGGSNGAPLTDGSIADPEAAYRKIVELEARKIRLNRDARKLIDEQDAERLFRVPPFLATLTDELAIPDEPVSYLVDELVPSGANVLLTAQYKTGKTSLVNNLARALVDGEAFLDKFGVEPFRGRVVLFNYEVDSRQYRRWLRDVGIRDTDRVAVLNLRGYRLPLTVPHVEDWVVDFLREREAHVWIVDPFARAFVGCGDENDNGEVGIFLDTLDVIKERAGVDVLVIPNHTGRAEHEQGQERGRGATRLDDWADVRWILTKDKGTTRYFRATGRDVEFDEAALAFDESTRHLSIGGGSRRSERERRLRDAALVVIGNLQVTPDGATTNHVRDGVRQMIGGRLDNNALGPVLEALMREGAVRRDGNPRAGGYRYHLIAGAEFDPLAV